MAALLLGSGDDVDLYWVVQARQHFMDTIKLPKQRRRYFSGDNDDLFFNGDYVRGRQQLIREYHSQMSVLSQFRVMTPNPIIVSTLVQYQE